MHFISLGAVCVLSFCSKTLAFKSALISKEISSNVFGNIASKPTRGGSQLLATEKDTLAEFRDKISDADYSAAYQILKRNPLTQLGAEDARILLNNIDFLTEPTADAEKNQQQVIDSCTFLYKRLERQNVLKGFGCVDGEYPEKSLDITPAKLEQVTGLNIAALTPMQRTTYWRVAGIGFCLAEYALGKSLGIDPLTTLIPATFAIFATDQIFYRGAFFETVYQKLFPEYKKKIIYHEAGHFLLAYLLGIPVRGCVTNAWDASKYPEIKGQAGTIFFDPKLSDELLNQKITRTSLDRMSVVIMAGIAAEAVRFGKAEGGAVDEQSLVGFLTSIQPPWNILRIQGQARWAAMQAILLIREHEDSYDALCTALEEGKSVGDAIQAIENNLPIVLPSLQRILDRKTRKKTMESDLLMRYIQKVTWKVGGIEEVEYDGNIILGENPHEKQNLQFLGEKKAKAEKIRLENDEDISSIWKECLTDVATRIELIKSNDGIILPPLGTLEEQINNKKLEREKIAKAKAKSIVTSTIEKQDNSQSAVVGMDGYIIDGVPMRKKIQNEDPITEKILEDLEDENVENEKDEAVKLFKQKIRRLEKAAKSGQLDVSEKTEVGGVWINNLESLNLENKDKKENKDDEENKNKNKNMKFPGLNINSNIPPNIIIPSPIEGYEDRIAEMVRKEQKNQEEILTVPNEDNVLKYITSEVDKTPAPSDWNDNQSGVKSTFSIPLTQSVARDISSKQNIKDMEGSSDTAGNVPRGMLLTRRGYQLKKLENLKAGYSKKVDDIDIRMTELRDALAKRDLTNAKR